MERYQQQAEHVLAVFVGLLLVFPSLVVADWSVTISGVFGNSIDFSTGDSEPGAYFQIELFDVCSIESPAHTSLGTLYPFASTVPGMTEDHTGIVNDPGAGNKISYTFNNDINTTSFYTDNMDNTATVLFCARVGLYDSGTLNNWAEVMAEYTIDLTTNDATLTSQSIAPVAEFTDAVDSAIAFDGTLESYFCDQNTFDYLPYTGLSTTQGSTISVCFRVPDGQFEVKDVQSMTAKNADDINPNQELIYDSNVVSSSTSSKTCYDNDNYDTNVCVVEFLLNEDFYGDSQMTITAWGTVLLELGDSTGTRKLLRSSFDASSKTAYPPRPSNSSWFSRPTPSPRRLQSGNGTGTATTQEVEYTVAPGLFSTYTLAPAPTESPAERDKASGKMASIITGCVVAAGLLIAFIYCAATGRLSDETNDQQKHDEEDLTSGSVGEGIHQSSQHDLANESSIGRRSNSRRSVGTVNVKAKSMGHGQMI